MGKTKFIQDFSDLVNAGFPYIYIPSYEEERITAAIEAAVGDRSLIKTERKLYVWTQTDGLMAEGSKVRDTAAPLSALDSIAK